VTILTVPPNKIASIMRVFTMIYNLMYSTMKKRMKSQLMVIIRTR